MIHVMPGRDEHKAEHEQERVRWLARRSEGAELPVGDDTELVADEALQLIQRLPADHHQPHQVGAVVLLVEGAHRLVHADAPRLLELRLLST